MHGSDRPANTDQWMRYVERTLGTFDQRLRGAGSLYAAGNMVTTTDASGLASFLFGVTFPDAPVVVPVGGNDENVSVVAVTTTGFTARFRQPTSENSLVASGLVRCLWHAFPATI